MQCYNISSYSWFTRQMQIHQIYDNRLHNSESIWTVQLWKWMTKEPHLQFETMKEPRSYIYEKKSHSIAKVILQFMLNDIVPCKISLSSYASCQSRSVIETFNIAFTYIVRMKRLSNFKTMSSRPEKWFFSGLSEQYQTRESNI